VSSGPNPASPTTGYNYVAATTTYAGATTVVTCATGYTGSGVLTCNTDRTWSSSGCAKKDCGAVPATTGYAISVAATATKYCLWGFGVFSHIMCTCVRESVCGSFELEAILICVCMTPLRGCMCSFGCQVSRHVHLFVRIWLYGHGHNELHCCWYMGSADGVHTCQLRSASQYRWRGRVRHWRLHAHNPECMDVMWT
jgi:hypothetical protein